MKKKNNSDAKGLILQMLRWKLDIVAVIQARCVHKCDNMK